MSSEIGEQIRKWRQELGLSLRELAELTKMDYTHLWRIEQGRVMPREKTISAIKDAVSKYSQNKQANIGNMMMKDFISYVPESNHTSGENRPTHFAQEEKQEKKQEDLFQVRARAVSRLVKIFGQKGVDQDRVAVAVISFLDILEKSLQTGTSLEDEEMIAIIIETYDQNLRRYADKNNQGD